MGKSMGAWWIVALSVACGGKDDEETADTNTEAADSDTDTDTDTDADSDTDADADTDTDTDSDTDADTDTEATGSTGIVDDPSKFDVVVASSGIPAAAAGTVVSLAINDNSANPPAVLGTGTVVLDASGTFSYTFHDVTEAGRNYSLSFWMDTNGNNTCEPSDELYMYGIPAVAGDVTVQAQPRNNEPMVCLSFM